MNIFRKVGELASEKASLNGKKKLYYISAEFLIGKLLSNNLINLGIYEDVKNQLAEFGKDICSIEEIENEPSVGNGGLGRLAACFLDSIATLGLNGDGIGLNYHFGLFRQVFKEDAQTTIPDKWFSDNSWLNRTDKIYPVIFGGAVVAARLYEINVTGYDSTTNNLRLFDIEGIDESMVTSALTLIKQQLQEILLCSSIPMTAMMRADFSVYISIIFLCLPALSSFLMKPFRKAVIYVTFMIML